MILLIALKDLRDLVAVAFGQADGFEHCESFFVRRCGGVNGRGGAGRSGMLPAELGMATNSYDIT